MELYDFFELCNKELKRFNYAKNFYKIALEDFRESRDITYFINFLKRLYMVQGEKNFEKITGFEYKTLDKKENNINDIIDMLDIFVKINGKKNTAQESGLSIPTINNILSKNKNVTIHSLEKLLKVFDLNIKYTIL